MRAFLSENEPLAANIVPAAKNYVTKTVSNARWAVREAVMSRLCPA